MTDMSEVQEIADIYSLYREGTHKTKRAGMPSDKWPEILAVLVAAEFLDKRLQTIEELLRSYLKH